MSFWKKLLGANKVVNTSEKPVTEKPNFYSCIRDLEKFTEKLKEIEDWKEKLIQGKMTCEIILDADSKWESSKIIFDIRNPKRNISCNYQFIPTDQLQKEIRKTLAQTLKDLTDQIDKVTVWMDVFTQNPSEYTFNELWDYYDKNK